MKTNKIIVIAGPTGVGKTQLSVSLAKKYNAEIINADSMQIYKDLNIGTAKITKEETEGIPHHLFSIKAPNEAYSIYDYQKDCRNCIKEIKERDKNVIIVGGTGLYIKSALYNYKLEENPIKNNYEQFTLEQLWQKLISKDKKAIGKIDKNNRRRVENALNYYENYHKSITENITDELLYDTIFIGLTTKRDNLYNIINNRVDKMIKSGLIEEVKHFHEQNIRTKPLTGGIGYRELYSYFDGNISLEKAISDIKKDSRNYAKRQYTFFNNKLPIIWFDTNYDNFNETIKKVSNYIDSIIN